MFLIATNITTRNPKVASAFTQAKSDGWNPRGQAADVLKRISEECTECGADALEVDIQQHFDEPEAMRFVVEAVQQASDLELCLSANRPDALVSGVGACKRPPIVNYVSIEESRLRQVLPLAASSGAGLVLLASDAAAPADAKDMLEKAAILVGAANSEGISSERIFVDPGLIHVTSELGQRHAAEIIEFLRELPGVFDPPIRSTCWLSNSSSGAPAAKRAVIETGMFLTLAGAGLSSVFMDVLRRENRRAVRLSKIFRNELVYSDSDVELQ